MKVLADFNCPLIFFMHHCRWCLIAQMKNLCNAQNGDMPVCITGVKLHVSMYPVSMRQEALRVGLHLSTVIKLWRPSVPTTVQRQPAVTSGLHVRSKLTCHLCITPDRAMSYIRHQFLIEQRRFCPFQCSVSSNIDTSEVLRFWEENRWLRWAGLTTLGWWGMSPTICLRGSLLSPTTNCLLYWHCHYSPNFFWLSEKVMFQ